MIKENILTKIHDDYIKNRFSTWLLGWPSMTSDRMILAIFDLQVTPILPIKFRLNWSSIQEKKFKVVFQDGNCGSHLVFPIGTILAIFDLQVTWMILTKLRVNWPFSSGEEAKKRFSRWLPSWIFDWNDLSYFWSTSHPDASFKVCLEKNSYVM